MKKSQFNLKLKNKIFGKTNVPTHTAQLKKMIQEDEYLN